LKNRSWLMHQRAPQRRSVLNAHGTPGWPMLRPWRLSHRLDDSVVDDNCTERPIRSDATPHHRWRPFSTWQPNCRHGRSVDGSFGRRIGPGIPWQMHRSIIRALGFRRPVFPSRRFAAREALDFAD
jgi:hypothetical protein